MARTSVLALTWVPQILRKGSLGLIAILFVVQAGALLIHFATEVAPYPPDSFDQGLYLAISYDLAARGWSAILSNVASAGAQGALFLSEGAALEKIFRLPRLSALFLNYGMLAAAEVIVFATARRVTQSVVLALASVGLFLSAHTGWFWAGGLYDFRIDWLAACAYGIWCCAVLRSEAFADRRWSIAAALAAGFLILNRYVAGSYIFGVEAGLLIILLLYEWRARYFPRVKNLCIAAALQVVIIAPFIYNNRHAIHDYYVVGHLTGSESKIRAQEAGVNSFADNILYYPRSILADHLGSPFLWLGLTFFVCAAALEGARRLSSAGPTIPRQDRTLRTIEASFLLGAIAGPVVVLTTDLSKSPVVGGVVDIPIVLLIALLPHWLGWRLEFAPSAALGRVAVFAGGVIAVGGLCVQIANATTGYPAPMRLNQQRWSLNVQAMVLDAVSTGKVDINIAANSLSPHFLSDVFTDVAREMGHGELHFASGFIQSIYAPDIHDYLDAFTHADYAILSDGPRARFYPISPFMADHDAEVRTIVQSRMERILAVNYDGGMVETYRRRPDFVTAWMAGSYGEEVAVGRPMQWLAVDSVLKVSRVTRPCMVLPLFGMGGVQQSVQIENGASVQTVDLDGADVFHPRAAVLPLPGDHSDVTFTFHAVEPARHFPADDRAIAFGAGQASGADCPDRKPLPN